MLLGVKTLACATCTLYASIIVWLQVRYIHLSISLQALQSHISIQLVETALLWGTCHPHHSLSRAFHLEPPFRTQPTYVTQQLYYALLLSTTIAHVIFSRTHTEYILLLNAVFTQYFDLVFQCTSTSLSCGVFTKPATVQLHIMH